MESRKDLNVDGILSDEFSPDFEEFEANYFDNEDDLDEAISEDEDSEYCKETQDQEFYIDPEDKELNF